jgi:predicted PurR-regulated permease PerM
LKEPQSIKAIKPLTGTAKFFILLIPLILITVLAAVFTDIFITLVFCLLLALVLNPAVDYLESKGLNRTISILLVYVIIGAAVTVTVNLFIPNIVEEATSFQASFKEFELSDKLKDVERWIEKNVPFLKKGDVSKELQNVIKGSFTKAQDVVKGVLSTAFLVFLIPFVTFFILRDRRAIKNGFISLVPNKYFEMTVNIVNKIEKQLSSYVRGWIFDAMFVGILSMLGLSLLGINNAIMIGVVAGAGHLIPYAGPIIGGIPAILISVIQFGDFSMVIPIVLMFTAVYLIDNSIAQPYIFSKSADMNPITIIALLLIGNQLLGAFGMLIAIPIAAILKVSARETINGFRNYKLGYY